MTPQAVQELLRTIAHFYPTRFDPPAPRRLLWQADLAPYAPDLALECLKEWVRWHGDYPPELGEFVGRCRTEAAKRARAARALPDLPAVLHPDHASYAQLMTRLLARTVWPWEDERGQRHAALTPEACARQCVAWAEANVHRPALARELLATAAQYRGMEAEHDVAAASAAR